MSVALAQYAPHVHADVLADINRWATDRGLRPLHLALQGEQPEERFLDSLAEVLVARRLERRGCGLRVEVPTPSGRACDFEVTRGDVTFYLHVKRLDTGRGRRRHLTISPRLRALERVRRPYLVQVRWRRDVSDAGMQRLVRESIPFLKQASVGDEFVVKDEAGRELGGVRVAAPHVGSHVTLAIGLPSGFIDETRRMRRLLRKAYRQFMPRATNVILLCSSHEEDEDDFDSALLGTHIERWDAYPPQGHRVAHGRDEDGLWHGKRYAEFTFGGWFPFRPQRSEIDVRFHVREGGPVTMDPAARACVTELFE